MAGTSIPLPQPFGGAPTTTPPYVARRGSTWLSEENLRAHFAALLRMENVAVLLGSGASVGAGGKTMDKLWLDFVADANSVTPWLNTEGFSAVARKDAEALADQLDIAIANLERQGMRPNRGKHFRLRRSRFALQRAVIGASVLQPGFWSDPTQVASDTLILRNHQTLLQRLRASRQPGQPPPWVFTTNYDLAVEWAAESQAIALVNGFQGLHERVFAPQTFELAFRNTGASGEARFGAYSATLVKLHGSLTWRQIGQFNIVEDPSSMAWPHIEKFWKSRSDDLQGYLVLPSAAKYRQTVGFLLAELFRRFAEFLARPQACLVVCGYSGADEHINRVVTSALQNPTLQLVVYAPKATSNDGRNWTYDPTVSPWLKRLSESCLAQVTVVGGGARAFFDKMVQDLPDPALYDDQATRARQLMKQLGGA